MKSIEDYILHKPPMRLIEELLEGDETTVTAALTVTQESTFYDPAQEGVPAWVGLEYMAQTAGVWVGMDDLRHGRGVELGFLVSARQYLAYEPVFERGERFLVSIRRQFGDDNIVVFEGDIQSEAGQVYASGNFTAYRPSDVQAYLRGEQQ